MNQNEVNLDSKCAEFGWKIADATKDQTLINKALGVLTEQGVYAFFLFLESRGSSDKTYAEKIRQNSWNLLNETIEAIHGKGWNQQWPETLRNNLLNELDSLSLAYQLLEQTLIYARYHAKALKED